MGILMKSLKSRICRGTILSLNTIEGKDHTGKHISNYKI